MTCDFEDRLSGLQERVSLLGDRLDGVKDEFEDYKRFENTLIRIENQLSRIEEKCEKGRVYNDDVVDAIMDDIEANLEVIEETVSKAERD